MKEIKLKTTYYPKDVVEDLLVEMLFLGLTGPASIRNIVVDLCEQLCEALDDEAIDRCKDYARYRKNEYLKTLEE